MSIALALSLVQQGQEGNVNVDVQIIHQMFAYVVGASALTLLINATFAGVVMKALGIGDSSEGSTEKLMIREYARKRIMKEGEELLFTIPSQFATLVADSCQLVRDANLIQSDTEEFNDAATIEQTNQYTHVEDSKRAPSRRNSASRGRTESLTARIRRAMSAYIIEYTVHKPPTRVANELREKLIERRSNSHAGMSDATTQVQAETRLDHLFGGHGDNDQTYESLLGAEAAKYLESSNDGVDTIPSSHKTSMPSVSDVTLSPFPEPFNDVRSRGDTLHSSHRSRHHSRGTYLSHETDDSGYVINPTLMKHLRDTFLEVVRTYYWKAVRMGKLERNLYATRVLVASVDHGLELTEEDGLKDWDFLASVLETDNPERLCGLVKAKHYIVRRVTRPYTDVPPFWLEERKILMLTTFIDAHLYAQRKIPRHVGNHDTVDTHEQALVIEESIIVVEDAKRELNNFNARMIQCHKSHQVILKMFHMKEDLVLEFEEEGILSEEDSEHLLEEIARDVKTLNEITASMMSGRGAFLSDINNMHKEYDENGNVCK